MATTEQIVRRLGKLQSTLLTSGIQTTNQALYQVINQLIQAIIDSASEVIIVAENAGSGNASPYDTYLTTDNESTNLPNSSQFIAGDNVSFDNSIPGQLKIDVSIPPVDIVEWSVLTNSDTVNPELIFAGGDVIMTHIP